jgi:hypothetical protein
MRVKFDRSFGIVGLAVAALLSLAVPAAADVPDAIALGDEAKEPFAVAVKNASAKVGADAHIEVEVSALSGFKCNEEYPHKIKKIVAAEGASVGSDSVKGSIDGKKIVFRIPVKASRAGTHAVTGQIRFSVCDDSQCVIKKIDLNASIIAS